MQKPKVIVTRRWPKPVEDRLTEHFDTTLNLTDAPMTTAQLQHALQHCDALLPTVSDAINADVLSVRPMQAKALGSYGVGFNHIDLSAARAAGLTVTNTPEVLTDCTADLAMALLLGIARRIGEGERHCRAQAWTGWRPTHMLGTQVTGKTLGLIGMGRIARAVAARAVHGFGMKVLFHDPMPPTPDAIAGLNATACDSPEAVYAQADFISLHCPGGAATRHLISTDAFRAMQPHAYLINTARGDVIDEAALVHALKTGEIRGAGLDVFEHEPAISAELRVMEQVLILPHLGSATMETRIAMGNRVINNMIAFFNGDAPPDRVA